LSSTPTTTDPANVPRYPPLEQFFGPSASLGAMPRRGRLTPVRFAARARRDPVLLLAVALAIPVLVMEALSGEAPRLIAVAFPVVFIALELGLTATPVAQRWWTTLRLGVALLFVLIANIAVDQTGTWPLNSLMIPVVALAAAIGGRNAVTLAAIGVATSLLPVLSPTVSVDVHRDAIAIAMAAIVMAIGSRRIVQTLERSGDRLRRANARDRRRARQFGALEAVGRLLARDGLTTDTLDRVMGLLEETFGYRYPSVYLVDGAVLRLGAQRNYRFPIETVALDQGVIGRVVRTREPILLRDARDDPDFQSGDPAVIDEIAVPLMGDDELFGILNVETDARHRLDDDDFATMVIVGDRIAAAIALGRERQKLTERTQLLDRLTSFEATLNASLDPQTVHQFVVTGAAKVIPSEMVILVLHQAEADEFRTIAIDGGDERIVGVRIEPGEGITGRAISKAALVVDDHLARANWPRSASKARLADVLTAMSAPLVHDDVVVGAMSWFREDTIQIFTPQEQEIATLIANRVALALVNATLHQEAQEAAITDPLTALHNRRHFDASMAHDDALRSRLGVGDRRERSAILFDLDHFGAINKRHGHRVGDDILRTFADVLRSRVRASDLTARYGGEEFVVILDGASRDEAVRLADEVRLAFRQVGIDAADSGLPITTVSAGCASLDRIETSGSVLIERADVGLAMAKAGGRDQVVAA
jgi:diguanylate cyclase (GGDEF)-like protein